VDPQRDLADSEAGVPPLDAAENQSWLRRHAVKLGLSVVIAIGFAVLLKAGALPLVPSKESFANVRWWTVAAYPAIWLVVHFVRAGRWYWLLAAVHRVPLRRVLSVAFVGFAALVVFPLRMGEVVRPMMIRKKGHLTAWAATGTVAAERIIDGLALSVILFVSLQLAKPLDPLPDRIGNLPVPASVVPGAAYVALLAFAGAFLTMALFYWRRAFARRVTESAIGLVSKPLGRWVADRLEQVANGLTFLPRWRLTAPFLGATLLYWLLNAASGWLLAWGCGFENITFAQACANMGVLALGILLPNAPGFFGAYQISVYAGFAMYFAPELVVGPGSAYVFFMYLSQLLVTIGLGLAGMAFEHTSLRDALEAPPELEQPGR
jgi:hypothetical protein